MRPPSSWFSYWGFCLAWRDVGSETRRPWTLCNVSPDRYKIPTIDDWVDFVEGGGGRCADGENYTTDNCGITIPRRGSKEDTG